MFDVNHGKNKITIEAKRIMLAVERVNMRLGMQGLIARIQLHYGLNPVQPGTLWLFCGKRRKMLKGLLYRPTGFVLITKVAIDGVYQWPRCEDKMMEISVDEFERLMEGYTIVPTIRAPKLPEETP